MKEITDAVKLRRRTQEVFELAALPGEQCVRGLGQPETADFARGATVQPGTPSPAPKVWIACLLLPLSAGTSEEDRKRLLTFVVVGGGPTGVEFAGAAHSLPDNRSCAG